MKEKISILALHLAFGGVEKAIVNMANLFTEMGHPVEILCVYDMPGGPAFPLNPAVKVTYLLRSTPNREAWRRSLQEKRPVAFVKESFRAARTLLQKKSAVRRAVRSVREGVLITTRHEDNMVLSRCGSPDVLKIAQLHHDHQFAPKYVKGFAKQYRNIDIFALLTPQLAEEAREIMKGNTHTRVLCIPNFIDALPAPVSADTRKRTILAVGRLHPVKGFDRLIQAFSRIHPQAPDWKLAIIGDGEERSRLEALAGSLGLKDSVLFTGRKNAAEIEEWMLSSSLYAMTSLSEGLPFVLIEAFSCGLPAVAYDVRVGPRAVVEDGKNGFLVPDGDERQYTEKLLRLMQDDSLRRSMSEQARVRAAAFTRDTVRSIWQSVLEMRPDGCPAFSEKM